MFATETPTQLNLLHRYFREAWVRRAGHADGRLGSTHRRIDHHCCPIEALQDNLLRLLAENHDRPASDLAPQIRCMIVDRDFAGDADELTDPHHDFLISRYAAAITDALEHVRQQAVREGIWSCEPVTPQMFG